MNKTPPRICDYEGCNEEAHYPAPKSRAAHDYHWFCYKHVCLYNKQWNYFAGCSEGFIRRFQRDALVGMRPTWRFGTHRVSPHLRIDDTLDFQSVHDFHDPPPLSLPPKTRQALSLFSLSPSCEKIDVKRRYRHLVKLHHPDANHGDEKKARRMSAINDAYRHLLHFVDYGIRK